ncbi:pyruvate carboxylase [Wohlfahrtiimonas chitiniclastica]|uniref:pyruvate carboxylase n=1 Tax=Wohlfahrtiimonas chitiniclastica TaxID=400946 RepID=UPI0003731A89|nr:pyruvate carboxylase [Wohlfahrtiimonas chitiniclastica]
MGIQAASDLQTERKIKKILVANRSEIAIRIMRAASELGINTVAIYSEQDIKAVHRYKADESYLVGQGKPPLAAYLDIEDIIRIAKESGADAIHPGYGFLAENPNLAKACQENGIIFIGPEQRILELLGNKVSARNLAISAGVPVMPASEPLPHNNEEILKIAETIGYPVMLKASWGGGGRGMRVVESADKILDAVEVARREAKAAFGNDEVYLEKLVVRARHVEVQILGDAAGNIVHLFERDCTVQRRHQKVVERAPAPYLDDALRAEVCGYAVKIGQTAGYVNAGTVEFLMDADTNKFYFIEVNPRIQVEHTVTEAITGIDIVKAQIGIAEGLTFGDALLEVPTQDGIKMTGAALQCRITTEDPANGFVPDHGVINAYRSPAGFGIRLDGGTAYAGAVITPYYDSLLVKVTTWGRSAAEAIERMDRALREFRVRGLATNLLFVENVINHPLFINGECITRFIDETPSLFTFPVRRDRASYLLKYLSEVQVNGNPEVAGRDIPKHFVTPVLPTVKPKEDVEEVKGTRIILDELGAKGFSDWMLNQKEVLITDTTMRDAHQSLFATRVRSHDLLKIASYYQKLLPKMFSMECWGGATFDVAMRFLNEDPWDRLEKMREAMPNILLQMLIRGVNGVGYTSYPNNAIQFFVEQAAKKGIDLFRVFDSLNIVDNMRFCMDSIIDTGKLCEATICYTSDIHDAARPKYQLEYYVKLAKELEKAGAHIIAIKDMAGLCRAPAARQLVKALKEEVGLPIHFHTHDTSGISGASVLAAVEAGVDAVDCAIDSFSGLTSQPPMGSILRALEYTDRDPKFDYDAITQISTYFEGVRSYYAPFESGVRSGTSDIYRHEMPGGQYTNLKEQARSLGLESRWDQVAKAYADVNTLFGDIVKVTPSSKVVGDMALMMVTQDLTPEDVVNPNREIAFPASVTGLFNGELGIPESGLPKALSDKILQGKAPEIQNAGSQLPPVDFDQLRTELTAKFKYYVSDTDLASYIMYPKVFTDFVKFRYEYGDVSIIPTKQFFYPMAEDETFSVQIEKGKDLLISYLVASEPDNNGDCQVYFELNGEQRIFKTPKKGVEGLAAKKAKADPSNNHHVGAPMPGMIGLMRVKVGDNVKEGDALLTMEAMKMETILRSEKMGVVKQVYVQVGDTVESGDLLIVIE